MRISDWSSDVCSSDLRVRRFSDFWYMDLIGWLTPWEFSPTFLLLFFVAAGLFLRGCFVRRVTVTRQFFFWFGMVLLYMSLHTRVDYYAERMFFIHRLQHLVLHHLGPLLIIGAYPGQVMRAGLPMRWRFWLRVFRSGPAGRAVTGDRKG